MAYYRTLGPVTYLDGDRVKQIGRAGVLIELTPEQAAALAGMVTLDLSGPVSYPSVDTLRFKYATAFPQYGSEKVLYFADDTNEFYRWANGAYETVSDSGEGGGSATWNDLEGKPAVVAAGANAADARAVIGALGATDVLDDNTMTVGSPSRPPSQKATKEFVLAQISNLIGAAPAELDTWIELVAAIQGNQSALAGITTALSGKQPLDATLTALAALATSADKIIYATGPDTFTTTTLSAFIRTLLDDATAADARNTLGLGPLASLVPTGTADATTVLYGDGVYRTAPSGGGGAATVNYLVWTGSAWPVRPTNGLPTIWVGGDAPDDSPPEHEAGDIWVPSTGDNIDLGAIVESLQLLAGTANTIPYFSALNTFGALLLKVAMSSSPSDVAVLSEKAIKDYVDKLNVLTYTADRTLDATNIGIVNEFDNTTNATFTLPSGVMSVGDVMHFRTVNTGVLTIAGTGVVAKGNKLKLSGQWTEASLHCRATGSYVLTGDLTA